MLTQPKARSDSAPSSPDDGSPSAGEPDAPVNSRAAQRVIDDLFGPAPERLFGVRYWDGAAEIPVTPPSFTLVIRRPGALRRMLLPPSELSIVEAYLYGDIDIQGDIEAAATLGDVAAQRLSSAGAIARLAQHAFALARA